MQQLRVDIWSDIACPWCYVGKRRIEAAIARFSARASVELHWRAFELNPGAPQSGPLEGTYGERLAGKYGVTLASGEAMVRTMTETAAAEGLDFRFDHIRPGNTFDAHRLVQLAAARGQGDAAEERLMRAYMSEGLALDDRELLARLAAELGLDATEVRAALDGDAFELEVRADEREARERGITGVPYFLLDGRRGLAGAQSADVLLQALQASWAERTAGSAGSAGSAGGSPGAPAED